MLEILIVLVVVGVLLYFVNTYIPLDPPIRMIINVIFILFLCVWILRSFGVTLD